MSATFDPVTSPLSLIDHHDEVYKNLGFKGTFSVRSCSNITLDGGSVGGNSDGVQCQVGAVLTVDSKNVPTYLGAPSANILIRRMLFHDMTVANPSQHHEALYVSGVNGLTLEDSIFRSIYGNTADLFFTGWETQGVVANHVAVLRNLFGATTNGVQSNAIQWNDSHGAFHDYLIEGNLFDGAGPNFGTLTKPVTNFKVGRNYGDTPDAYSISYAKKLGVEFTELPFRPKSEWPGASVTPPPIVVPPPVDPRDAVIARLQAQIAAAQKALA